MNYYHDKYHDTIINNDMYLFILLEWFIILFVKVLYLLIYYSMHVLSVSVCIVMWLIISIITYKKISLSVLSGVTYSSQ